MFRALTSIEVFIATGSVDDTARRLGRTRADIEDDIDAMSEALGIRIADCSWQPTSAAAAITPDLRQILEAAARLFALSPEDVPAQDSYRSAEEERPRSGHCTFGRHGHARHA